MMRSAAEEERAKPGEQPGDRQRHDIKGPPLTFQPHRKVLSEEIILQLSFVLHKDGEEFEF